MQPANPEILTTILTMGSVVLWGAFAWFLGVGIYNNLLGQFVADLREDRASGVGAGSLAVRRIGSVNRRLMWPGYESRRRRDLIRAGEPKGYKPEDIMAMQEIGFVFGLLFGLLL